MKMKMKKEETLIISQWLIMFQFFVLILMKFDLKSFFYIYFSNNRYQMRKKNHLIIKAIYCQYFIQFHFNQIHQHKQILLYYLILFNHLCNFCLNKKVHELPEPFLNNKEIRELLLESRNMEILSETKNAFYSNTLFSFHVFFLFIFIYSHENNLTPLINLSHLLELF